MPKDHVSYKLLHRVWKKESADRYEKLYDQCVEILDPDGDIGLAEEELSYEELMWLMDKANKQ